MTQNIFDANDVATLITRINKLTPATERQWGTMTVAQMMAHCNVSYELVYENRHPKPNPVMKFFLKSFVKKFVVGEKPFKQSLQTAPAFVIKGDKDFDTEKARLTNHIAKTMELGESYFDKKESHYFGVLTLPEWNTMFYKHLDHHLKQFGV